MVGPTLMAWLYNGDWLGASAVPMISLFTWKLLRSAVDPLAANSKAQQMAPEVMTRVRLMTFDSTTRCRAPCRCRNGLAKRQKHRHTPAIVFIFRVTGDQIALFKPDPNE